MVRIPRGVEQMPLTVEKRHSPAYIQALDNENEEEPWYIDILNFVTKGEYLPGTDKRTKRALRLLASQYVLINDQLHKRAPKGRALLRVPEKEAQRVMRTVHEGVYGTHMNGKMLVQKIIRQGYYWRTMEKNCHQYVKKCPKCQIYANLQHIAPSLLYAYTSPGHF